MLKWILQLYRFALAINILCFVLNFTAYLSTTFASLLYATPVMFSIILWGYWGGFGTALLMIIIYGLAREIQKSEWQHMPPSPNRFCLKCHYNLRGIQSVRCPECGQEFDPNDPQTYQTKLATPRKWLGWIFHFWMILQSLLHFYILLRILGLPF